MSTCPTWCSDHRTATDEVDGTITSTHAHACGELGVMVIQMHDITEPHVPRLVEQGILVDLADDAGAIITPIYARALAADLLEAAAIADQLDG
jgi:hypothetical protein